MGSSAAIEYAPSGKNQGGKSFTTKGIWSAQSNPRMSKEHLTADSFSRDILEQVHCSIKRGRLGWCVHILSWARGSHSEQEGVRSSERPRWFALFGIRTEI